MDGEANQVILSVKDVYKRYGKNLVLKNVNFEIKRGQTAGLLGPNGSGKTTIIKIINTLIMDYEGEILICGQKPGIETKKIVSYMPDLEMLEPERSVISAVRLYSDFFAGFDAVKAYEMANAVGLEKNMRIRTMSKGTREKLQLVLTMARRARLYVFDEPLAGIDPASREFVLQTIIRNYNDDAAILLSTHLVADVEQYITRALFLKNGEIIIDQDADELRGHYKKSIDMIFRDVFKEVAYVS